MIILGIDPGTTSIGYALLEYGRKPCIIDADLISIKTKNRESYLKELHRAILNIINKGKPDVAAVERVFFAKNTKTAIAVAEARGAILLTTSLANIPVYEYTPLEVKRAVTGDGLADKNQIKKMLQLTLRELKNLKAQDDVFDAIGIALTCGLLENRKKMIHYT